MLRGSRRMDMGKKHVSCYTLLFANNKIVFTIIPGCLKVDVLLCPDWWSRWFLISMWGGFLLSRWGGFLFSRWDGFFLSRFLIFRRVESLQMHSVHSFHHLYSKRHATFIMNCL